MELKWKTCLRLGVTVMALFLLIYYWSVISGIIGTGIGAAMPLIIGCMMAYVLNILMSAYERLYKKVLPEGGASQKLRRPVCLICAFISIILIIFFIVGMIVPELVSCFKILQAQMPGAIESLLVWLENNFHISSFMENEAGFQQLIDSDWQTNLSKIAEWFFSGFGGAMGAAAGFISSVFSVTFNIILGLIFSIYLLIDKERIERQISRIFNKHIPDRIMSKADYVLKVLDRSFHSFIVGQCFEAVILGVLCIIGMLILRLPYAAMIGSLIGFTALIPIVGAYLGAVVGAFLIFMISPIKAFVFIIFLIILQQVEGNFIYPRVVGASIGLPGLWVLAAVTIGGSMMGIGGMLIGVPIAAAVYHILKDDVNGTAGLG